MTPTAGGGLGWRAYALLALTALAFFLPGRARLPPVDRDEARYAQATRQMLESGDFVQVRFQHQARNLQPVGIYWLESAAVSIFSKPEARQVWAYRIPSLIAGVAAVLLTAWIGEMLFGAQAGAGAALLMAMCALLSFESRMAKIDACLLATVLVAQGTLLRAYLGRIRGAGRGNAALFWGALGVGLLLKGPIILIVSGTTVAGLAIVDRRAGWLKRLHAGWGVLATLAIALPWFTAIGIETHGAFFDKAVKQNLLGKIGRGEQSHGLPPSYYVALFSLTFWPGALAALFALPWAWRNRGAAEIRFLACWVVPTWVMYEFVGTKLPHYVLPLYPALACLAAGAALAEGGWTSGRTGRVLAWVYGVLWAAVGLLLASAGALLIAHYEHRLDAVAIVLGLVSGVAVVAAAACIAQGRRRWALGLAGGAAWLIFAGLYVWSLPALSSVWLAPRIAALTAKVRPCPHSMLASTAFAEPSLVFLEHGPTRMIGVQAAADLVSQDRACAMALVGARQLADFTARAARDGFSPQAIGRIEGVNYSRGRALTLTLFRASPQAAPAPPR